MDLLCRFLPYTQKPGHLLHVILGLLDYIVVLLLIDQFDFFLFFFFLPADHFLRHLLTFDSLHTGGRGQPSVSNVFHVPLHMLPVLTLTVFHLINLSW